jgi:hypothetical protein
MNFFCKIFGHNFQQFDLLLTAIKLNSNYLFKNMITCRRCGFRLDLNNQKEIDNYLESIKIRKK